MADLSLMTQPTVGAIIKHWEVRGAYAPRPLLGIDALAKSCKRQAWFNFRWAFSPVLTGQKARKITRTKSEKLQLVDDLKSAGIELHTIDDRTGQPFFFSRCAGHVGDTCDGVGIGFFEAPKKWHVLNLNVCDNDTFKALNKSGVSSAHTVKANCLMHWMGIDRTYYLALNKNNDELFSHRIRYDAKLAEATELKAWDVVRSPRPLEKVSTKSDWFECNMCDYTSLCWENKVANVNCRTCIHATPTSEGNNGAWICERKNILLTYQNQISGCDQHLFIPDLIPWATPVDANVDEHYMVYQTESGQTFWNGPKGPNSYTSEEIQAIAPELVGDQNVESIRSMFDAKVVGA